MSPHILPTQLSPSQSLIFLRASSSPGQSPLPRAALRRALLAPQRPHRFLHSLPAPAATELGSGLLFPINIHSPSARALPAFPPLPAPFPFSHMQIQNQFFPFPHLI